MLDPMECGAALIYQAALTGGSWLGYADLLIYVLTTAVLAVLGPTGSIGRQAGTQNGLATSASGASSKRGGSLALRPPRQRPTLQTANVLNKLPNSLHAKAKRARPEIWSAWAGERICRRCKNTAAWQSGVR